LADRGGFQEALGFQGFNLDESPGYGRQTGEGFAQPFTSRDDSVVSLPDADYDGSPSYFPEIDEDTTHLTDPNYLQPMATTAPHTPRNNPRHDPTKRVSFNSSHLSPSSRLPSPVSPRLGDDLAAAEAGMGGRGRRRGLSAISALSLSPSAGSSPFERASIMMRKMSQRVVNISNEPEPVLEDMHRKPSHSHSAASSRRPSEVVQVDEDESHPPIEKLLSPTEESFDPKQWKTQANPLRGRSLGIFSPTSRIRTTLCDILVNSATEQVVLGLIIIQTILLAVEAGPSVFDKPHNLRFGLTGYNWAIFGVFIVYSLEIAMRIIVSGLMINPIEYSTINRGIGWKKAITLRLDSLFVVHGQSDSKNKGTDAPNQRQDQQLPSLLRTLTGKVPDHAFIGNARHQKRLRLARRAFLRHSFNRIDILAVVSFWISFGLSVAAPQDPQYIFVFRMLSALRILRLLSLTSGTSVGYS